MLLFFSAGFSQVSTKVSSPTDVRVTCHNFENVVYWNYSDPQLQPEFTIIIRRYIERFVTSLMTTKNYLDISNYTREAKEVYHVSVNTLNGSEGNNNEFTFTYDEYFPLGKKCKVDFPSVNTSALKHTIEVSFEHPLDVYDFEVAEELLRYTVKCNETDCGTYECTDLCTAEIPIPESLYGSCFTLHFSGSISSTLLEGSEDVCSPIETETRSDVRLITGVVCAALVLLLMVIVAGVEVYKKVTRSDSQRTISKILGIVSAEAPIVEPERPPMSEVRSISHTPLLITPDDDIFTPTTSAPEEVTHLPSHFVTEVELPEEKDQRGSEEEEDDFGTFPGGGYDRQKFPLEISPGDVVEGYRP